MTPPTTATGSDRSEIAFFDLETAVPSRAGLPFAILEFGAILVCPRKLVELCSYSTLVRPSDLSLISSLSVRRSGISRDAVVSAPLFADVADRVFDILHGRIWAGHNILRFDCARIREAFAEIGRPPPEPKGIIDSLALLTQKFGRRAGDMKMASLATYFGLGEQVHRSLDDVRMNLEVLKYCATVLFLESSLPDIFTEKSWFTPRTSPRRLSDPKVCPDGVNQLASSQLKHDPNPSNKDERAEENHPILSLMTSCSCEEVSDLDASGTSKKDPFDMKALITELNADALQPDDTKEEKTDTKSAEVSSSPDDVSFLDPDQVSLPDITASFVPFYRGSQKIRLFHNDSPLQLCCCNLKVRFGMNQKFIDYAGRPRLNFVVDAPPGLCKVLDACDVAARDLSIDSGSSSDWRPIVARKNGFLHCPTARLHIPSLVNGGTPHYGTDIYQQEASGTTEKLVFTKYEAGELEPLFSPGTLLDAFFSLEPYDYQQMAGIRLVAKTLVIHSEK